jgi:heptosyltransferase-2
MGDILLTTPFIRQVRKRFPRAEIDFVVKEQFIELIGYNPNLDDIFQLTSPANKKSLDRLFVRLNEQKYDILFDLHNNLRSKYIKRRLKIKDVYSIRKDKFKQQLLVHTKINLYRKYNSIPFRYLQTAKDTGVEDDTKGLEIFWQNQHQESMQKKTRNKGLNIGQFFLCLAPGAGFYTKRWPLEHYSLLAEKIQTQFRYPIAIIGGEEDREYGSILARHENCYNFCGDLSLLETAVLLSQAGALVSNDSGLMHLATATGTPVLALFGSTVKEWGFFPFRGRSVVLERHDLPCRPCSHIGRHKCPRGHFKCMRDIKPRDVFQKLMELID